MKVLIIGANGFLGRHLASKLTQENVDLTCCIHNNNEFLPKMRNVISMVDLFETKQSFDSIFLLASHIPYENMNSSGKDLLEGNILLPLRILERFPQSKIIFASSVSVYGNHEDVITEESTYINPNAYGRTKLAGETIIRFAKEHQIIRFSSLYGKGMTKKTFLPQIIRQAKENKTIAIFGNGSRLQDYLHVDDAVMYCLAAMKRKITGMYLCTYGKSYANKVVAEIVQRYVPCTIIYSGNDTSPSFQYNNMKSQEDLKFSPQISLEEGIKDIIDDK